MSASPNFKEIIRRSPIVFTIGVAGDSISGKTTFTNPIRQIFGQELVATITLDDYHSYDRKERKQLDIPLFDPTAIKRRHANYNFFTDISDNCTTHFSGIPGGKRG